MRNVAYGATVMLTVGVVVELLHVPTLLIFVVSALALIGLAWVLGQATESLGHHSGPRIGGRAQRHIRERRRAHHHHIRSLRGPHDGGEGLDHRLHYR